MELEKAKELLASGLQETTTDQELQATLKIITSLAQRCADIYFSQLQSESTTN